MKHAPSTTPRYCIDLFAGCGGLSLGLELAGFTTILFNEINKDAANTYKFNRKAEDIPYYDDVHTLTNEELEGHLKNWEARDIKDIDLVCGGPPCQGFSGIGHRRSYHVEKEQIPSNFLFQEMVRVIRMVRPKMFLFENVKGLLSSKWTSQGVNGEIWARVQQEFKAIPGYRVDFKLVHARDYGVPQNRPRVLMVGLRDDINWEADPKAPASGLLPYPTTKAPDLVDAFSDLLDPKYREHLVNEKYLRDPITPFQEELRTLPSGEVLGKGDRLTDQVYSDHSPRIREKFQYMIDNNGAIPEHMQTKKFAQKVLPERWGQAGPSITATSMPDDYVHYCQPRILTVREWARLQTFPDWYEFTGPRTTGGLRRAGQPHEGIWTREVPRYTQIGNAVPVKLAHAVGVHFMQLLEQPVPCAK